jgi:hypothetical protein
MSDGTFALTGAAGSGGIAGTGNVPLHIGHFITCPEWCSGTVSIFWQWGQRRFMVFLAIDFDRCATRQPRPSSISLATRSEIANQK